MSRCSTCGRDTALEAGSWGLSNLPTCPGCGYPASPAPAGGGAPSDVDRLAQLIRVVDGNGDLGAGALAEQLIANAVRLSPGPTGTAGEPREQAGSMTDGEREAWWRGYRAAAAAGAAPADGPTLRSLLEATDEWARAGSDNPVDRAIAKGLRLAVAIWEDSGGAAPASPAVREAAEIERLRSALIRILARPWSQSGDVVLPNSPAEWALHAGEIARAALAAEGERP